MLVLSTSFAKQSNFTAFSGKSYFGVEFSATVTDTDPALSCLTATLDWSDGTPADQFGPAPGPLVVSASRNLGVGTYFVALRAANFRSPVPDQASAYFSVEIQASQLTPQPINYLFGPILPLDSGSPNVATWNFDIGNNIQVLASSVKMLLITNKGERLMQPAYGTFLRRALFQPDTASVTSVISQEITDAVAQFEPRVTLDGLNVLREGSQVLVNAQFLSKIDQSSFQLQLPVTAQ
jgi:phage baseplate assembly protein W